MTRTIVLLLAAVLPIEVSAATTWYVRNNAPAGGNGTLASPFDHLATAETQSQPGDTIVILAGDQTAASQNSGITLKDGQTLAGDGNPTITNRNGPAIRLANNNTIRGLTIVDSKEQGIVGQKKTSNLTIDHVTIQRSGAEALMVADATGVVAIDASQFETGPGDLVRIGSTSNLSLEITNSHFARTTPPNGNDALRVIGGGSGSVRVVAHSNTFDNILDDAIDISGRGDATDSYALSAEISDNKFATPLVDGQRIGANAIAIKAQSRESFTVDVERNTLTSVGGPGAIELTADDAAAMRGRIAGNTIVGASASGIDIQADETTDVAIDLDGNTIRQSARYGISAVGFPGNARLNLTIRNNHVTLSQRDGVMLALYGGSLLANITGNDVTAPVGMGFLLSNMSPGVFMLEGDPARTAQENVQRSNTGSAGVAGVITVTRGRQHAVHR